MKFVNIFVVLASVLFASEAVITRPDSILTEIDAIEQNFYIEGQKPAQNVIRATRASSGDAVSKFIMNILDIVEGNIRNISVSDVDIRKALAAQKKNNCINSLATFLDHLIELSGYAIANCVDNSNIVAQAKEFSQFMDTFEHDANVAGSIFIQAYISRNIFTEGNEVLASFKEQVAAKRIEYQARIVTMQQSAKVFYAALAEELVSYNKCCAATQDSINNGIATVQKEIPVCAKFGSRGGRSAVLDAADFFPQLLGKYF